MNALKVPVTIAVVMTLMLANIGCKAGAAKNAGFVDASLMKNDPSLPFHAVWKKSGFDMRNYSKVYVAPVVTTYLLTTSDWQKGERKDQFMADVVTIAKYTEDTFKKAYKEDPKHKLTVIDAPERDSSVLVVKIALTEIVPSKVVLNALGYAPFFVGMGITAARMVAQDASSAAIEVRIEDGATGETLMMIADRESEQMAVVTVRGLTWYSHLQAIASQWASQFVAMASQKPGEAIKDSDGFTLQPW